VKFRYYQDNNENNMKLKKNNVGGKDSTRLEMGKFYFLNQKYDEALRELNQAIEEDPDNAEVCYNLGLVYEAKGEFNQAKTFFQRALEVDPGHKPSEEHLAKLVGG